MKLIPEDADTLICKITAKPFVIYGMGYVGCLIAEWCEDNKIAYIFSDSNIGKRGAESHAKVVPPDQLMAYCPDANIVVASVNYYDEIKAKLAEMGFPDSSILSYLLFWPKEIPWDELEANADWDAVYKRAEIFAAWIDKDARYVADYSIEKNFLKEFLPREVVYSAPQYYHIQGRCLVANFQTGLEQQADVSSCLAVLMSFQNPEEVIQHICNTTSRAVILSYVPLDKMPNINFRRSINYVNDFTEQDLIDMFAENGFFLRKQETDPFDVVHEVYLFERKNLW